MASDRGRPTSTFYLASAMPTPGRRETSPCRKQRGSPSSCGRGQRQKPWNCWPNPGGRGAQWLRGYCGPIIGRSRAATARRSSRPNLRGPQSPRNGIRRRRSGVEMAGELDGPRLPPKSGSAQQLVVFLHGYGADGNDLIDIGRAWQQMLPHAAFVSPHAPEPCGQAPVGRQWFALTFRDPNERWTGVKKAAPLLDRFIDAE